jgi:hypothetical protein
MMPADDAAPVVVYRKANGGFLVTGLTKRDTYKTYTISSEPAFFDTPAGKALLLGAGLVALGILASRPSGEDA